MIMIDIFDVQGWIPQSISLQNPGNNHNSSIASWEDILVTTEEFPYVL